MRSETRTYVCAKKRQPKKFDLLEHLKKISEKFHPETLSGNSYMCLDDITTLLFVSKYYRGITRSGLRDALDDILRDLLVPATLRKDGLYYNYGSLKFIFAGRFHFRPHHSAEQKERAQQLISLISKE